MMKAQLRLRLIFGTAATERRAPAEMSIALWAVGGIGDPRRRPGRGANPKNSDPRS